MTRVGHERFFYHGGDWGSFIGKAIASLVPERIAGLHITAPMAKFTLYSMLKTTIGSVLPSLVYDNVELDYKKMHPLSDKLFYLLAEMGYMHLQATKPDTVGVALRDSPIGLACYILEKFSGWTRKDNINKPDGGLLEKFTMDELLTNVMVYYVTGSITTSQRLYKEFFARKFYFDVQFDRIVVPQEVPVAFAIFPDDLISVPRALLHEVYHNITQYHDMERGGHFAGFEEPLLVANDIRSFLANIQLNKLGKKGN
jgi:pimeloyl-ACP methyl ester carboxylesterase